MGLTACFWEWSWTDVATYPYNNVSFYIGFDKHKEKCCRYNGIDYKLYQCDAELTKVSSPPPTIPGIHLFTNSGQTLNCFVCEL